jgi:hypothetical protein
MDGQTDTTKLIVTFRNFGSRLKKELVREETKKLIIKRTRRKKYKKNREMKKKV